jgi:hypothetical protein
MSNTNRSDYIKAARPETLRQAQRWDIEANRAEDLGLCRRCAGQYAWGVQIGFGLSRPPCPTCADVVDMLGGQERPNGWRVLPRKPLGTCTRNRPRGYGSGNRTPLRGIESYAQCRRCGEQWTGYATCHCSACHITVTDISAFDKHRHRGRCLDPEAAGLTKIRRAQWTGWALLLDQRGSDN